MKVVFNVTILTLLLAFPVDAEHPHLLRRTDELGDADVFDLAPGKDHLDGRLLNQIRIVKNPTSPLGECEGDCDSNEDCSGNLICLQRNNGESIPGCTGKANKRGDFCIKDPNAGGDNGNDNNNNNNNNNNGQDGLKRARIIKNPTSPLGECEGDCNSNKDCSGNLICLQRNNGESIPGCTGKVNKRGDFCIKNPNAGGDGNDDNNNDGNDNNQDNGITDAEVFYLKLYWQKGYFWQEETFDRKFCLRCIGQCGNNKNIELNSCDKPQKWSFIERGQNNVQIRAHGTNLCMTTNVETVRVRLAYCNVNNPNQRFMAVNGSFNSRRFEISPRTKVGWCLTSRHHPRNKEPLRNEPCPTVRKSHTSFWNKY